MTDPKRIILTGAAGLAGRGVRPLLRERGHQLVLVDVVDPLPVDGERAWVIPVQDTDALREAIRGADAVIHLGGHSRERAWPELVDVNMDGTRSVLEAARLEGVSRVLLASSTHAVGFHPVPRHPVAELQPRPDSYYGVSKVVMEALGTAYADRYGMSVANVRIGTVLERPNSGRTLSTWLSYPDLARLIDAVAALDTPGAHLVWGVSHNSRAWFTPEAGHAMGYYPEDDAEQYAAEIEDNEDTGDGLIGGGFADMTHELGESW
jgi:uronate dehydrogenase